MKHLRQIARGFKIALPKALTSGRGTVQCQHKLMTRFRFRGIRQKRGPGGPDFAAFHPDNLLA